MNFYIQRIHKNINFRALFSSPPIIAFKEPIEFCCGNEVKVLKTQTRKVNTLETGVFHAHETILCCDCCGKIFYSSELNNIVSRGSNFGYDVIDYVGRALFAGCKDECEIQESLKEKSISISIREIGYLGKKFIIYLSLLHKKSKIKIRKYLLSHGGFILHLDGTCEKGSPHLLTALDELTNLILGNVKLPSENKEEIIPFLEKLRGDYGSPLASVHDMGSGICKAVEKVFPGLPDYICHYHFLRDIGKDLFEKEHLILKKRLASYGIKSFLKQRAKTSKGEIDQDPKLIECLLEIQKKFNVNKLSMRQNLWVTAYLLILFILDYKSELKGYGFPFDRVYLVFYQRVKIVHKALTSLGEDVLFHKAIRPLFQSLDNIIQDKTIKEIIPLLKEKVNIFDELRCALRIALPNNNKGLNDDGDSISMKSIKRKVTVLRKSKKLNKLVKKNKDYKKFINQIDKYWDKLFADPISVTTPMGTIMIQPQRTNNILERFFREFKRKGRKKGGSMSLSKMIKGMIADTPLVKNLENPEYRSIILNGKQTFAERFADIDIVHVRKILNDGKKILDIIPLQLKKVLRSNKFKNLRLNKIPKYLVA